MTAGGFKGVTNWEIQL